MICTSLSFIFYILDVNSEDYYIYFYYYIIMSSSNAVASTTTSLDMNATTTASILISTTAAIAGSNKTSPSQLFLQSTACQVVSGLFAWAAFFITAHHVININPIDLVFIYLHASCFSFRFIATYKTTMSRTNKNG